MGVITLTTTIISSPEVCFGLATSIELHKISTRHTQEEAVAGVTSGLIKLNEQVTWRAKHFGLWFRLTSKITEYHPPHYFVDEMISGPFKYMRHEHTFAEEENKTILTDKFEFSSPLGPLGKLVDALVLDRYMENFLILRNNTIKEYAETGKWKELLTLHP